MPVHTRITRVHSLRPKLPPVIALQFAELVARNEIEERDRLIRLLNVRGWPASAIAVSSRMRRSDIARILRKSREPITVEEIPQAATLPAPKRETADEYGKRMLRRRKDDLQGVPKDIVDRLLELKPMATASTGKTAAYQEEAAEYSRLVWLLHSPKEIGGYGLGFAKVARLVGQSATAIKYRLVRYGYIEDHSATKHPGLKPVTHKQIR